MVFVCEECWGGESNEVLEKKGGPRGDIIKWPTSQVMPLSPVAPCSPCLGHCCGPGGHCAHSCAFSGTLGGREGTQPHVLSHWGVHDFSLCKVSEITERSPTQEGKTSSERWSHLPKITEPSFRSLPNSTPTPAIIPSLQATYYPNYRFLVESSCS